MDKFKTLAALAVASFGLLSQVCSLLGYAPPLPIDKLLHLTQDQLTTGFAIALAFLTPLHELVLDAWTMLVGIFTRDNAKTDQAFAEVLAKLSALSSQYEALKAAQPVPVASLSPVAQQQPGPGGTQQAGRVGIGYLFGIAAIAVGYLLGQCLSGCSIQQQATVQSDLQRVQAVLVRVCPTAQATLTTLQALSLDPAVAVDLDLVDKTIGTACAVGTGTSVASLQALANTALPKLDAAVKGSSLDAANQQKVIVDLGVANALINEVLVTLPQPAAAASAPASSASAP